MFIIFLCLMAAQNVQATDGVTILFTGDINGHVTEVPG